MLRESALFRGKYIWFKFHQNRRYPVFEFSGGQKPPIRGGVTFDL